MTLDPSERHGFEYQSWFGFTLYAAGVQGAVGRGGTYRILGEAADGEAGEGELATGFSLYPDRLVEQLAEATTRAAALFLPLGHDPQVAANQRAVGWRTVAALSPQDDPVALGCSHRLEQGEAVPL